MLPHLASCALLLAALSPAFAQSTTLSSDQVLRIHFTIPAPPAPPPDVLAFGIGAVTVNAAYTTRTARLWNCHALLGVAASSSFGSLTGPLFLGVCNSWNEAGSVWNFDNPGIVASFAALQTGSIQGIIDFELSTGSITLNLSNISMSLTRATSASGGTVCSVQPTVTEVVVVQKLTGPSPGTAGGINTWSTTGGAPNALIAYAFSLGCAPILVPAAPPVYFDLASPTVLFAAVSDPNGASTFAVNVPAAFSGNSLLTQCAELNLPALRVSNFVSHLFP